ncbi:uncharacterized protein PSFLO_05668 [Pseudozyma flocculosa]|uniref:Uncharacterized protein n=1 Tax=Pseudozyma flocculosa TaxID=84751 RepID=A0A5C3F806_9BASI|nr:uncharacterized protein PSFLO_05668 [Pseudozyma flocculosa]
MAYRALHERFDLPPPPAKSIYATIRPHDWQRAWLPDFTTAEDPVGALQHFLYRLFHIDLANAVWIQAKVLSILCIILLVAMILILARRYHERSLWFFRFQRRSNGTLVIPNTVISFTVMLLFYCLLCTAINWVLVAFGPHGARPNHIQLWVSLIWIPLALGAYLYLIGITLARPNALESLSPQHGRPKSLAVRLGITPMVFNIGFMFAPLLHVAAILGPSIRSDQHWQRALDKFDAWQHRWAGSTDRQLSREMLLEAQDIWYEVLHSCYQLCVSFSIWTVTGAGIGLALAFSGGRLALLIHNQIKTMRSLKTLRSLHETAAAEAIAQPGAKAEVKLRRARRKSGKVRRHRDLTFASAVDALRRRWATTPSEESHGTDTEDYEESQTESMFFSAAQLEEQDTPAPNFFPAVKPSTFHRPPKVTAQKGQRAQRRYLERFLADLMVQICGIVVGCFVYAGISLLMAIQWYACWEANRGDRVLTMGLLGIDYGLIMCGTMVFACILGRTYEPVLTGLVNSGQPDEAKAAAAAAAGDLNARSGGAGNGRARNHRWAWGQRSSTAAQARSQDGGLPARGRRSLADHISLEMTPRPFCEEQLAEGDGEGSDTGTLASTKSVAKDRCRRKSSARDLAIPDARLKNSSDDEGDNMSNRSSSMLPDSPSSGIMVSKTVTTRYEHADSVVGEIDVYQADEASNDDPAQTRPDSPSRARLGTPAVVFGAIGISPPSPTLPSGHDDR